MIRLTGADADNDLRTVPNGGHVENSNGYDIMFTSDLAGTTVLDHQIEYYDGSVGEFVAWVRIPSLSNSVDTEIYMYYGNCAANTDPSTTDVWSTNFDAVYFLHDDFQDATANNNDGTNSGSTDLSPALIADGQSFGVNDYVQVPTSSISLAQGTLSIWAYAATFSGTEQYLYGHTSSATGFQDRIQLYTDDGLGGLDLGFGGNHNLEQGIVFLNTGEWYHLTLTWDGSACSVYVNGVLEHTESYAAFSSLNTFLDIGNNGRSSGGRTEGWDGDLDHARMSNNIFSANWIQTEYNNQRTGSTFLSIGDEMSSPTTYYSRASGAWDDNNSWSLTPDGSSGALGAGIWPGRYDHVVIQNSHTITINSTDDNYSCGISADDLGRSNVGNGADPFTGSGDPMFYHTGNIIVGNGGTLSVSEELMIEGYTLVEDGGTLSATEDVINLGYLEFSSGAIFSTTDDLILSGNSVTIMDNTGSGADDLYIEWTDAILCGTGDYNVGNGGTDPTIQYFNGATDAQICETFTVTCASSCTGVPATGTGSFITGNSGLGGIGDANNVQLWLRADDLSLTDGDPVTSWDDVSGNGLSAVADGGGGTEPTFDANTINITLPSISFDGGDYLNLGQPVGLDFVPGTDSWSFFIVYNVSNPTETGTFFSKADGNGGNRTYQYTMDQSGGVYSFTSFIGGNWQTGTVQSNTGNWFVSSHSNNTTIRNSWTNEGTNIINDAIGTNTTGAVDVLIGARRQTAPSTGTGFLLEGSIAEIAMYDGEVTEAQRVIITNYLAAKYGITLSLNDVYTEDDNGYDFEVIGIGQASDGTNHRDSQGLSAVRIWNPNDLDNGEYLMTGHDNTGMNITTTALSDVDGTVIEQRLSRIWSVSESGDVGTINISIDFSSTGGSPLGSNLRLLIDRDGDFSTNDVTPIEGTVSNNIAVFSGVDFMDGDRFTLGNTDISAPLPIELTAFSAIVEGKSIILEWETASELDNDYFTIQRSIDGGSWENLLKIDGAGTSKIANYYKATDTSPYLGGSYYRLMQTDFDGTNSYSSTVFVWFMPKSKSINVFPNPSESVFHIITNFNLPADQLMIFDLSGKKIYANILADQDGIHINLGDQKPGIYLLQMVDNQNTLFIRRLIKR